MGANNEFILQLIGRIDKKKTESDVLTSIKEISKSIEGKEAGKIQIKVSTNLKGDEITKISQTYKDSMGNMVKTNSQFSVSQDGIAKKLQGTTELMKDTTRAASSMGAEMGAVIRRTLESAGTLGLLYGALNQLRMGVQYIKDLDKELTNVQVVTGMSETAVNSLAMGYNSLAKEMGVTTLEVAKGSLEWIRQGKTAQESGELVKSSMVLSKLGNLDAAQSTEYLTSALNGFKLEAKDSMGIIDKIIALDNSFSTSAGIKNFA